MLQAADFDPELFSKANAGDDKLFVTFYNDAIQDVAKSEEEGRPIYTDTEMVRIMVPGDRNNVIVRAASKQDIQRFKRQYDIFKSGAGEVVEGTPLAEWPPMTKGQVEEFRFFGVRSVEQLADLRDDIMLKMPGASSLKQKAKVYLELAAKASAATKFTKENEDLRNKLDTALKAIADQGEQIKALRTERAQA